MAHWPRMERRAEIAGSAPTGLRRKGRSSGPQGSRRTAAVLGLGRDIKDRPLSEQLTASHCPPKVPRDEFAVGIPSEPASLERASRAMTRTGCLHVYVA